ncbi:MAG: recombination protein RecR [Chlamydiae bacterium SM23_39]|nr:MAG: recombination protein RecR [Chlamydiae bacterium SM23_39]
MYPKKILTLISFLKKLPGVGFKTAERFAFELIKWNKEELKSLANILYNIKETLKKCTTCGCLKEEDHCYFCDIKLRNNDIICIISSEKDAFSIEEIGAYKGLFHVVSLISPIEGFQKDDNNVDNLKKRIINNNIKEVIIALDSTLEGDATSLFLKNKLKNLNIKISRLAFGLPIGSSLEYIDKTTLAKAFFGRQNF